MSPLCTRAHQCTPKNNPALPLQPHTHPPSKQHPTLNTETKPPAIPAINPHTNKSLVALQHVSLRKNESLHTRIMTSERCHIQGRLALPTRMRVSHTQTQPFPAPATASSYPPSRQHPALNNATQSPTTQPSILIETTHFSHCSTSAFARMRASTQEI